MGLRIGTNVSSLAAQRSLAGSQREISKSFAQLSSGSRITKAADDAAGLSISESLKTRVRGYAQAGRNASDGMSLVQVAEGGLGEINNIVTRLRELGVQAASDTIGDKERSFINVEVRELKAETDRIAKSTKFGEIGMLDGSTDKFQIQVDVNNNDQVDRIEFNSKENDSTLSALKLEDLDFSSTNGARTALAKLDTALNKINSTRANLGAIQNRLISASDNISSQSENLSAANSRIRDTDIASSSAELTRNTVLMNASVGVLAQANQSPAIAMKLLG